jgi:hypothetical protein
MFRLLTTVTGVPCHITVEVISDATVTVPRTGSVRVAEGRVGTLPNASMLASDELLLSAANDKISTIDATRAIPMIRVVARFGLLLTVILLMD